MTVPLDVRNDIRSMDARGVPRSEIARRLHLSRNTVARYADIDNMSPRPPVSPDRLRPAIGEHAEWIDAVLEADLGAPRKQRHTAKRIYDRLVKERGYKGSYSSVQRYARQWKLARASGIGEGYLELEWAPGTAQVDYGNFEAIIAGKKLHLKLLVLVLPHSNARFAVAGMSQCAECMCTGLSAILNWMGRAPREIVLDNATEAGRRIRGKVSESHLFSLFRAHYRMGSRYCNPYSGNEKGSVENAVGFLRRNLLVPVPRVGSLTELNALLRKGCDQLNATSHARGGGLTSEALAEDLAAMLSLPAAPFDAVRWVACRADKRGVVTIDGRGYLAGPAWHSRELLCGIRADMIEILADRGRRVAVLPRAFGDGPTVRNPRSLIPALIARPRAFGESVIRHDMPKELVRMIDSLDTAGRRRALRSIDRAARSSGFEAACVAAQRVIEGGRIPDDATVDVLARRMAAGAPAVEGAANLSVYDGFLREGEAHAC